MELLLTRKIFTEHSTIGDLTHDGKHVCYILEDKDRYLKNDDLLAYILSQKVYGKTAIPTGRYEIVITFSNKFKKPLPLLMDVKGFEGIRIHSGNTEVDSLGCLLTGTDYEVDRVNNSRAAFLPLATAIELAIHQEKVFITIQR